MKYIAELVAEINRRIKVLQEHPKENHKTICHLDSVKSFIIKTIIPKYKIGDTIRYNSFGEIKEMVVAKIIVDDSGNPMYEDENCNGILESEVIDGDLDDVSAKHADENKKQ